MHSQLASRGLEELQTKGLQVSIKRHAFRRAEGTLAATCQVTAQAAEQEPIQLAKGPLRIAMSEVLPPASGPAIDFADQLGDGQAASPRTCQVSHLILGVGHRLLRGKRVEVAMLTTQKVAIVPQRESQKAQT